MAASDVVTRIPEIYKALTAFVSALALTEGSLEAVVASTGVAPAGWVHALTVGGAAITGFLTWLVRNEKSVNEVVKIIKDNQSLAEQLIEDYKKNN